MHFQFEAIHPFSDSNGRTGRILNVLYLKPRGLLDAPIIYVSRYFMAHRSVYYRLLRAVTGQGDWQAWVRYLLIALLIAVEENATDAISRIRRIQTLRPWHRRCRSGRGKPHAPPNVKVSWISWTRNETRS